MDFETALNLFVTNLQAHINNYYATKFPSLTPDKVEIERGSKFVKVVTRRASGGGSVHCFIVVKGGTTKILGTVKPGDILKAASWKQPAKHVRGSIFATNFPGYGVDVHGANYLG